jgi:carbamoyl-phosphate synthase large subunit
MKFLLIGGGRRNQFCLLLKDRGIEVHSYELDTQCPISLYCEKIIPGKRWKDETFKDDIIRLSEDYDLIIPLMDEATKILSELNLDNGCVSDVETVYTCLNKKQFEKYCISDCELIQYYPVPDNGEVVVKPVYGFGANGIFFANSCPEESDEYVIQKRILGKEYSVDCFYDTDGTLVDFVPRERVRVVSGEVMESVTLNKTRFEDIIKSISRKFKFKGPTCVQFIEDNEGKLWIMEINARMGGGSTLSISSGFDIINLMISCFCKKDFSLTDYESNWKENYYLKRFTLDYCYEDKKNSF